MKLFFAQGACSLAPHVILRELDLPFELEAVDLRTKVTSSGADFKTTNAKGSVPALQLDDGEILTEGVSITQFLADHYAPGTLAPAAGTVERARLSSLLNFLASELHASFKPIFNPALTPDQRQQAAEMIGRKFAVMETALSDGRSFLSRERFSPADPYLFVMIAWVPMLKAGDLNAWPKIQEFRQRVADRASVAPALTAETNFKAGA